MTPETIADLPDWTAKRAALVERWSGKGLGPMTAFEMAGAVYRDSLVVGLDAFGNIDAFDRRGLLNLVSALLDAVSPVAVGECEGALRDIADNMNHTDHPRGVVMDALSSPRFGWCGPCRARAALDADSVAAATVVRAAVDLPQGLDPDRAPASLDAALDVERVVADLAGGALDTYDRLVANGWAVNPMPNQAAVREWIAARLTLPGGQP